MKRTERISELTQITQEWECSIYEAAYGLLFDFYETAGFAQEPLAAELSAMTQNQIIEAYLNI